MQNFKLADGRDWPFAITMKHIIEVETLTGVNVVAILGRAGFDGLADHMKAIVALAFCGATNDHALTIDEFADLIYGESHDGLERAVMFEPVEYMPPKKKRVLKPLLEASEKATQRLVDAASKITPADMEAAIAKETDRKIRTMKMTVAEATQTASGASIGSSPDNSVSTPDP